MPPARALGWTVVGIAVAVWSPGPLIDLTLAISIVGLTLLSTARLQPAKFFIATSLPFLVPLLVIHGSLNPQFPTDAKIWLVPYRSEGVNFAVSIYSTLAVLLALAAAWAQINRDELFDWMVARRVPVFLLGVMAQSIAMVVLIEKRGRAVFKAQTARGIPTGPDWMHRLRALPSIILPVVTSLINEADQRGTNLWSRGFLEYEFVAENVPFARIAEIAWVPAPIILPLIIQAL